MASTTLIRPASLSPREPRNRWLDAPALVLYIAAAKLIFHLLLASRYGYFVDELYFLSCSEHLAWGYIDQPPLIVFITWLVRHTLGESLLALRFLPALAGAALIWLAAALTREMGGGRFAQVVSAVAVLVMPAYLMVHGLLTMNAFEPLIWAACAYFVLMGIKHQQIRYWLAFGVLAGLGLENKYSIVLLLFGLMVGLILSGSRNSVPSTGLWLSLAVAFLLFLPNFLWQIQHGAPFLAWQTTIRASGRTIPFTYAGFLQAQLLLTLPAVFVCLAGVWFFLVSQRGKPYAYLGWALLAVFFGFLLMHGRIWYLMPAFAIAAAGGAITLEELTAAPFRSRLRIPMVVFMLLAGALLAPCFAPILPIGKVVPYQRALHLPLPLRTEAYEKESELPGYFAWEFGWPQLVSSVGRVYNALPPNERTRAGIFTRTYGTAGAIDLFGEKYGLPKAISTQLAYGDWGPRNYTGDILIVIEDRPEDLAKACTSVERGATLDNPYGYSGQRGPAVNVCRGLHADLRQIWKGITHY